MDNHALVLTSSIKHCKIENNKQMYMKAFNWWLITANTPPTVVQNKITILRNLENPDLPTIISFTEVSSIITKVRNINTFFRLSENSII